MRECERASVRVAIKKANKTNDLQVGTRSIYEWIEKMKDSNVDIESVRLCYRKYIKREELKRQKVLKWTRAMQKRIYYFYNIHSKDEFWREAKFCVDYLMNRLDGKPLTDNIYIRKQDNQRVLAWVNDKIVDTTSAYCIRNKNWKRCKDSLNYLKNLLLRLEDLKDDKE